jgi:hypothetical protein
MAFPQPVTVAWLWVLVTEYLVHWDSLQYFYQLPSGMKWPVSPTMAVLLLFLQVSRVAHQFSTTIRRRMGLWPSPHAPLAPLRRRLFMAFTPCARRPRLTALWVAQLHRAKFRL